MLQSLDIALYIFIIFNALTCTVQHVALTFPPARQYALDFLDNSRTKGPCGMPKGVTKTSFLSGTSFNATWHLAYPHRGGFRLQLLDHLERPVVDLTPTVNGSEFVRTDVTSQEFEINLPKEFTCPNCTLRLLRQADEWSNGYRFWSCADIDIVELRDFRELCSGHGKYFPSKCKCDKNYYGKKCQYFDECSTDQDCGLQGKCVDIQGTSLPKRQCYCNFGWYGPNCNRKSPYKSTDIDYSIYSMKQLSPDYKLYWRLLKDKNEMEFVMVSNSTSWLGLGWRPRQLTASCKNFPVIRDLYTNMEESSKSKRTAVDTSALSVDNILKKKSVPYSDVSKTENVQNEAELPEAMASHIADPKLESISKINVKRAIDDVNMETVTNANTEYQIINSTKNHQLQENNTTITNVYTPKHDFNPMDCTDIVIGTARGTTSRVWDYYTRDRSTPQRDEFWAGKFDLTAASGFEENGVTTILFRRKLESSEPSDHSIADDIMHVIWAKGQEPNLYIHVPPSGLEKENASRADFYKPDELKYHGHKMQRGVALINFLEQIEEEPDVAVVGDSQILNNECFGMWKYPRSCSQENHNCEYYVNWKTIGRGDEMLWHIETTKTKTWTGIGFSNDEAMSQTDAIIGWVDRNGRPFLMDTWINGYSAPKLDDRQDIYNTFGKIENGVTILEFTRKRNTNDEQDLAFTNEQCLYLFFPISGGAFNGVNKKIRKHEEIPAVTPVRVCIKSCGNELVHSIGNNLNSSSNILTYGVGVKLKNFNDSFDVPEKGTPQFEEFTRKIYKPLEVLMKTIPGYRNVEVTSFERKQRSIVVNTNLQIDKTAFESSPITKGENLESLGDSRNEELVKSILLKSITTAQKESLIEDLDYLNSANDNKKTEDEEMPWYYFYLPEMQIYVIVGCVVALIILAVVQACCTYLKASKKTRSQKDQLIANSAWKDYSSSTNDTFAAFNEALTKTGKDHFQHRNTNSQINLPLPQHKISHQTYDNNENLPSVDASNISYNQNFYHHEDMPPMIVETSNAERAASLPRKTTQSYPNMSQQQRYYTQDRKNRFSKYDNDNNSSIDTPDFYFMPSQRKYSGEVVRVYVDYSKTPK